MSSSKVRTEEDFELFRWGRVLPDGVDEKCSDTYVESRRWVEVWTMVWREGETYYAYDYEVAATEYQEDSESEFDPSYIYEVKPKVIEVIEYVKV